MKKCWFHKWKYVNKINHGTFMGEPITWESEEFRSDV